MLRSQSGLFRRPHDGVVERPLDVDDDQGGRTHAAAGGVPAGRERRDVLGDVRRRA